MSHLGNYIQSVDVYEASVTVCFRYYNRSVFSEFLIELNVQMSLKSQKS